MPLVKLTIPSTALLSAIALAIRFRLVAQDAGIVPALLRGFKPQPIDLFWVEASPQRSGRMDSYQMGDCHSTPFVLSPELVEGSKHERASSSVTAVFRFK